MGSNDDDPSDADASRSDALLVFASSLENRVSLNGVGGLAERFASTFKLLTAR